MSIEDARREAIFVIATHAGHGCTDQAESATGCKHTSEALDRLILEVKASMMCYCIWYEEGENIEDPVPCRDSNEQPCPSCEARAALGVDSTVPA